MLAHRVIIATFINLLLLQNELQNINGYASETEGLHYDNRCDLLSLSSNNCTTSAFCGCSRSASSHCHRLHIFCLEHDTNVCLKTGECITYDNETANMGWCPYYPRQLPAGNYCTVPLKVHQKLPVNLTQLTKFFCGDYNREGPLCSKCKPGYGPAVYAYSLMCVKCKNGGLGWLSHRSYYFILHLYYCVQYPCH